MVEEQSVNFVYPADEIDAMEAASNALSNLLDWIYNGGKHKRNGIICRVWVASYVLGRCNGETQEAIARRIKINQGAFRREVMDFRARFNFRTRRGQTSRPWRKLNLDTMSASTTAST